MPPSRRGVSSQGVRLQAAQLNTCPQSAQWSIANQSKTVAGIPGASERAVVVGLVDVGGNKRLVWSPVLCCQYWSPWQLSLMIMPITHSKWKDVQQE